VDSRPQPRFGIAATAPSENDRIFICWNIRSLDIFRLLKIKKTHVSKVFITLLAACCINFAATADDEVTSTNSWTPENSRFGLFNLLDHRSGYYQDSFPQPLLVEDTGLEETEFELNYLHTRAGQQRSDIISGEIQKGIGVATLELEVPYERFSDSDDTAQGVGNIEINARCPVYQYVSPSGWFDTTAGVGMGGGIPVNSAVSQNGEIEPIVFNDMKLGKHFTVQTVLGYDRTLGSGDDGGSEDFEYGLAFAYTIPREELRIPGVERISPMLELDGELGLNQDEAGQNNLLGSAGFRMDFRSIGDVNTSLGLGYVFPVTSVARDEVHWGIVTSFTVEF
jgi:hypothetical protein